MRLCACVALTLAAAVCFLLAAFSVTTWRLDRIGFVGLGLALLSAAIALHLPW